MIIIFHVRAVVRTQFFFQRIIRSHIFGCRFDLSKRRIGSKFAGNSSRKGKRSAGKRNCGEVSVGKIEMESVRRWKWSAGLRVTRLLQTARSFPSIRRKPSHVNAETSDVDVHRITDLTHGNGSRPLAALTSL